MKRIKMIQGRAIPIPGDDVDTDQIIPARFMKCVTFDDLGKYAFYDARFNGDHSPKDHPMNSEVFMDAQIMVVKKNFGCGSSREHAPQALMRWGIKALVGESFAEIFAGNCLANGIPVAHTSEENIRSLMTFLQEHPSKEWRMDLEKSVLGCEDFALDFHLPDSHQKSLLEGSWDTLSEMLKNMDEVVERRRRIPYHSF